MQKPDAKSRRIRWVLLLQEFDLEIKDKKGTDLDNSNEINLKPKDINDIFPDEQLFVLITSEVLWFANIANHLAIGILPRDLSYQQRKRFFEKLKHYFWEDPFLFKVYADQVICRCYSGCATSLSCWTNRRTL